MKGVLQRILQDLMKRKIMLGTSDAWSTNRLSHWPSETAYYIVDWRISTPWGFVERDKTAATKIISTHCELSSGLAAAQP